MYVYILQTQLHLKLKVVIGLQKQGWLRKALRPFRGRVKGSQLLRKFRAQNVVIVEARIATITDCQLMHLSKVRLTTGADRKLKFLIP